MRGQQATVACTKEMYVHHHHMEEASASIRADASPSLHPSTICCHNTSSTRSSSPTINLYYDYNAVHETDEAGRLRRAPLMLQQRYIGSWTDEAMDDADAICTTTTTHAWRMQAKTEADVHRSRIRGTPAS